MKAVILDLPPAFLEDRCRRGADRWDESWDGVLHMPPAPNRVHQNLEGELEGWLRWYWARPSGNRVYHQINLALPGGWPLDYRIPDLILLTPDRFHIDRNERFEGPPTAVVEIHSPGDESHEKLAFYESLGVPDVWIIHRDSRRIEIWSLIDDNLSRQNPDVDGWLDSPATGLHLRTVPDQRLEIEPVAHPELRARLPAENV